MPGPYAVRVRTPDGWQDLVGLPGPEGPPGPPGPPGSGGGITVIDANQLPEEGSEGQLFLVRPGFDRPWSHVMWDDNTWMWQVIGGGLYWNERVTTTLALAATTWTKLPTPSSVWVPEIVMPIDIQGPARFQANIKSSVTATVRVALLSKTDSNPTDASSWTERECVAGKSVGFAYEEDLYIDANDQLEQRFYSTVACTLTIDRLFCGIQAQLLAGYA